MDRLDELAVLVAVYDAGGLARAALRLQRSPAAVTRTLASLEARAGARLFERTTRKIAATEAGRRLAEQARRLLADYESAISPEAEGAPLRGRIIVTAPIVFGRRHVTPVVTAFLAAHPEVAIEMTLSDRNLDLIEEQIDVAVRIGTLADSGLVVRRVGQVRRVVVAAPHYLARAGSPGNPAELARREIVLTASAGAVREWRFRSRSGREQVLRLSPRLTVTDVEAALTAVRAGEGIGRALSYQVADDLAEGRLVRLLADYEPEPLPVQLVTPSGRLAPARVRAFLDHAARALSALPAVRA